MDNQILYRLKQETLSLHKKAEKQNLAKHIINHSISIEQYKELLFKNYVIYSAVENLLFSNKNLLPDHFRTFISKHKSDALAHDLSNFNISVHDIPLIKLDFQVNFASLLGILYVIEGSMLGGLVLKKQLTKCKALQDLQGQKFFGNDLEQVTSRWKLFCKLVEQTTFTQDETEQSVISAKKVFKYFIQIFSKNIKRQAYTSI